VTVLQGTMAMSNASFILVVEDSAADVMFLREALKLHELPLRLVVLDDGEKAIQWVEASAATGNPEVPAAVLLDLDLPKRSGVEVLETIRSTPHLGQTPVVIFTSSASNSDRDRIERYPSTRYFQKSATEEFMGIGDVLREIVSSGKNPD
jgi:CheY-like chemotaxis protein